MTQTRTGRPDLQAVLEDRGYRMTGPRRDLIALLDGKEEGFSAEEVSAELPGVGRATVYRTIKLLLEAGLVCKLALPDGAPRYSLARVEHHHHTLCVRCGTVGEFRDATIERLLRTVGSDIADRIVGHRMEFYIICRECLAA
ncbi:MAG: transcriptional repressor [Chloroflexi bacterium]|nr:transcriptional repressor [Chloroflexota bacterium]